MNPLPWLLAEGPRYMHMGEKFRSSERSDHTWELVAFLMVLLGLGSTALMIYRLLEQRRKQARVSPLALFQQLCRAHHLSWSDRGQLRRLARMQQLAHPALLFVQPERFDAKRLGALDASRRQQLTQLAARLFAEESRER